MWNPLAEPIIDRATLERVIDEQRAAIAKRDELLRRAQVYTFKHGANCDDPHCVRFKRDLSALLAEGKG